jgi:hypothetical protein
MEPGPQLTDIADAIRLAVTPIFLLAGVGITVNILIARLGRIVDRARVLEGQPQATDARPAQTPPRHPLRQCIIKRTGSSRGQSALGRPHFLPYARPMYYIM